MNGSRFLLRDVSVSLADLGGASVAPVVVTRFEFKIHTCISAAKETYDSKCLNDIELFEAIYK